MNNLVDYHDLYVQSDTFLLEITFEIFKEACLDTYNLDSACFYSAPCLTRVAALIMAKVWTDRNMSCF